MLRTLFFSPIKQKVVGLRFSHVVKHNLKRQTFFVKLKDTNNAVLKYNINGQIMDLLSINVPIEHHGQGLAKTLTETAFQYAIRHNYYLYLTCSYAQMFYLLKRTSELAARVVGPKHLLDLPESWSTDYGDSSKIPDPVDSVPDEDL